MRQIRVLLLVLLIGVGVPSAQAQFLGPPLNVVSDTDALQANALHVKTAGADTVAVSGTVTVTSVTANQGTPAAQANRWPVFLSDGTNERGTATLPVRTDPTGTTGQPVTVGSQSVGTVSLTVSPSQAGPIFNSNATSAANTALTVTITGVANTRVHLYSISAFCSAGSATLTIQDGVTTVFSSPATFLDTTIRSVVYTPAALSATTGNTLTITVGTCGVGNTSTANVVADRY